jgi:hypothetical protein
LVTGPGPDAGGSNQGKAGWRQMREKSGIALAVFVTLLSGAPPDATVCPKAGVATAAAKAMNGRKFRLPMPHSLRWSAMTLARASFLGGKADEAIQTPRRVVDCFASLAMTLAWLPDH